MNQRGQLSFEVALLVVLIFLLTFMAAGQYFQVHDTTYAVAKLKLATITELGTLEKQHAIKRIDYAVAENGKALEIDLYAEPAFSDSEITRLQGSLGGVCGEIKGSTVFTNAVSINFEVPPNSANEIMKTVCSPPQPIEPQVV